MIQSTQNDNLDIARQTIDGGQFDEALILLKAAAQANPDNPETYNLAGLCLLRLADYEAALDAFQRAIRIKKDWPDPYLGGAQAQLALGDAHGSVQTLLHVLGFSPQHVEATHHLVEVLARLQPDSYLSALEPALLQCFAHPDIDPSPLAGICGQQLRLSIAELGSPDDETLTAPAITSLVMGDLWRLYLSRVINTDRYLEEVFTRLRRHLCLNTAVEADGTAPVEFIAALAQQCYLNEYVFDLSDAEATQLATIDQVLKDPRAATDSVALAFSLSCLYRPPRLDSVARALAEGLAADYPWIESLCQVAVFEPFEEAQLAATLPTMHPVHDVGSLAVQAQYEVNPYPRWQAPPTPPKSALANDLRRQFSLRGVAQQKNSATRLLVAGCGTGFEPIDIARRDSSISITAIDLSRKSIAYAKRQAQALGCTNIDFYQGDILDLTRTQWEFDLIVCTGVLHHMADPQAGWEVLREKLATDGMMRISLYSAHARRLIRAAREHIRTHELAGQAEDIRAFRQWLLKDGRNEELGALLGSDDFYSMSGCRDLLFHVQEQQFTLPQIQAALDKLDLCFCGFDLGDASLLETFSAQYPGAVAQRDLEKWDIFEQENPRIFAGMYQFWCEPR